ncbi:MAG: histidine phosphatase family protein [Acidimicrobiales bacterium]
MDLLLIRHAEPVRIERPDDRPADPHLHERGAAQSARLAEWLVHEGLDALYSSPLVRARETAAAVTAKLGLDPTIVDGLAEFDRLSNVYIPMEELKEVKDERWDALVSGGYFGEGDPEAFATGVVDTIDGIVSANPGRRVGVVCHGGVINTYLCAVLGLAPTMFFEPRYTSISRVVAARSGIKTLVSINETAHLRGLPGFEPARSQ